MKLDVSILDNSIKVNATITTNSSTCIFTLAKSLKIHTDYSYTTKEISPNFQPPLVEYTFENIPQTFSFSYSGSLEGWFCFFEKDVIHFSFYNAWYPIVSNENETYDIFIPRFKDWICIQGNFDSTRNGWSYHENHLGYIIDCNILLIKKDCWDIYHTENLNVFSCYKNNEHIKKLPSAFHDIVKFYSQLYKKDISETTWIVFLPDRKEGAYLRDHLIVYGYEPNDTDSAIHLLAHETGHTYASEADINTFEDWINETHAEWSALSYMYQTNRKHFDKCIENLLENKDLKLNPLNGQRPQNVHKTGTSIYAKIFKQYGIDMIHKILKIQYDLPVKDTAHLLENLPNEISDIIQSYL